MVARVGLIASAAIGLSGCLYINAEGAGKGMTISEGSGSADPLYGFEIKKDELIVRVPSNGCTEKKSFEVDVDERGDKLYLIEFEREKPDLCKALLPDGVILNYSFKELGLPADAKIKIKNPLALN